MKQSPRNFPLQRLIQKKNRQEKFPFIAINNLIVLAVGWSVKYVFAPNFLIFQKSHGEEEDGEN